jgi:hypothetical protein
MDELELFLDGVSLVSIEFFLWEFIVVIDLLRSFKQLPLWGMNGILYPFCCCVLHLERIQLFVRGTVPKCRTINGTYNCSHPRGKDLGAGVFEMLVGTSHVGTKTRRSMSNGMFQDV